MGTHNLLGFPSRDYNSDITPVLFWRGTQSRWNEFPIFETPDDGLPIKTIYVDKETGKLIVKYDDGEDEEEE